MGVRSVQRRAQEQEKSKLEYEIELQSLRQQLQAVQAALDDTTARLMQEQTRSTQQHIDWQQRLKSAEERHRQHEAELTDEITRLKTEPSRLPVAQIQAALDDTTARLMQEQTRSTQQHIDWQQRLKSAEERHRQREAELSAEITQLRTELASKQELKQSHIDPELKLNRVSIPGSVNHATVHRPFVPQMSDQTAAVSSAPPNGASGGQRTTRIRNDASISKPTSLKH
jgi:bacterioferritin (cytochrome b1)